VEVVVTIKWNPLGENLVNDSKRCIAILSPMGWSAVDVVDV
jgi:hypothetical protein